MKKSLFLLALASLTLHALSQQRPQEATNASMKQLRTAARIQGWRF